MPEDDQDEYDEAVSPPEDEEQEDEEPVAYQLDSDEHTKTSNIERKQQLRLAPDPRFDVGDEVRHTDPTSGVSDEGTVTNRRMRTTNNTWEYQLVEDGPWIPERELSPN